MEGDTQSCACYTVNTNSTSMTVICVVKESFTAEKHLSENVGGNGAKSSLPCSSVSRSSFLDRFPSGGMWSVFLRLIMQSGCAVSWPLYTLRLCLPPTLGSNPGQLTMSCRVPPQCHQATSLGTSKRQTMAYKLLPFFCTPSRPQESQQSVTDTFSA